ncbi:MAG: signal peptidase I [Pseudohongiellaceae bacterium]|jgi:signal peptidase I
MSFDFSLLLLIFSLITGVIWLLDVIFLRKPREVKVRALLTEKGISDEDFNVFLNYLQHGEIAGKEKGQEDSTQFPNRKTLEQAYVIYQEPLAVDYAKSFFPIIFAVLILRSFLFEPFQIPTGSMIPTLNVGDFIVVNKYAYGVRLPVIGTKILDVAEPKRGDVMVFVPPHDPNYYIKRVIGLPGDHIRYEGKAVFVNGEPLEQEYVDFINDRRPSVIYSLETIGGISHDIYTSASPSYIRPGSWLWPEGRVIPEGHYFMMGDNRDNSSDSRVWGPASEDNIVGKAVAVWMHKEPGFNLPSFSYNRFIENP